MAGITIAKAIEILQDTESTYHHRRWEEYIDGVQLGIEAMKELQSLRKHYHVGTYRLLPGESEK